jgi:phosphoglycerol transferase
MTDTDRRLRRTASLLEVLTYAGAAIASLLVVFLVLRLRKADLHVPFQYTNGDVRGSGDAFLIYAQVKGVVDDGSFQTNPYLGMPVGMNMLDYPVTEKLHLFLIKLIATFTGDFAATVNIYFVLGFALTALAMVGVAREMGLSRPTSAAMALLFANLPSHYMRGQTHLFIGAYFMVPAAVMTCLWIVQERRLLLPLKAISGRGILALLICALTGFTFVYDAFFFAFFLVVTAAFMALRARATARLVEPALLLVVLLGSFLLCIAPNLAHRSQHGPNPAAVERQANDAEVYALRIAQMLLPVPGHRIAAWAAVRAEYSSGLPLVNENDCATLGFAGSVGFLLLLWRIVRRLCGVPERPILDAFAFMTLAAVLLATMGGFGSISGLLFLRFIRGYNRISVFIAALSLLAFGATLERLGMRLQPVARRLVAPAGLVLLVALGVLDQTTTQFVPEYSRIRMEFESDRDFVRKVESSLPAGAMIYQLPYVPFPESPAIGRMRDYQQFRGYLHSKTLRWSYGAMKGREIDQLEKPLVNATVDATVTLLRTRGFSGIFIDTDGFGAQIEPYQRSLNQEPLVSRDRRLVFFRL